MNTQTNDGGPAFPRILGGSTIEDGLSIRDWFAGMALQGDLAGQSVETGFYTTEMWQYDAARNAYKLADAMIEVRNQTKQ